MKAIEGDAQAVRYACDVVVIEDYKALADEIADGLRRRGMSVHAALDGAGALAVAGQCVPRVALVDCGLPDMDGIELVRQLGQAWPRAVFLVISGQVGGMSEEMARRLRIHAFLNKPLPMRALCQAVERLVRAPQDDTPASTAPKGWFSLGMQSPAEGAGSVVLATHPDKDRQVS